MYNDDEINLTLEERNAIASLAREIAPSDLLEARVVKALKSEGHFGGARAQKRSSLVTALRIAAAIALFAGGVATGRYILKSLRAPQRPRFNKTKRWSRRGRCGSDVKDPEGCT